jgi:mRNA interferase MazF
VESDGKHDYFERPVLLLRIFNKEMIWGLPITSTVKDSPFYHRFKFMDSDRSVMLTQVRTISAKRLRRKVDVIADADFEAIKCALCLLIKSETPALKRGNLGGRSH